MEENVPEHAVVRPWGWYLEGSVINGIRTKLLCIRPRQRISLQSHNKRSEIWTIVRGEGVCDLLGVNVRVGNGSIVHIPVGERHRAANISNREDLVISEVQVGVECSEDDIVRYEDDYGRV